MESPVLPGDPALDQYRDKKSNARVAKAKDVYAEAVRPWFFAPEGEKNTPGVGVVSATF